MCRRKTFINVDLILTNKFLLKTNQKYKYLAYDFCTGEIWGCFQTKGNISVSAEWVEKYQLKYNIVSSSLQCHMMKEILIICCSRNMIIINADNYIFEGTVMHLIFQDSQINRKFKRA